MSKSAIEVLRERLVVGAVIECTTYGGKPFDSTPSTVESVNGSRIYLIGTLRGSGRKCRSFLEWRDLERFARLTPNGFEIWEDGEPYWGYEFVNQALEAAC